MELDGSEQLAFETFLHLFEEQHFHSKPTVLTNRIHRTLDGQIIVPISLEAETPSLDIALLMGHKGEQIYKQTNCRIVLGQCPKQDPKSQIYVWADDHWATLP